MEANDTRSHGATHGNERTAMQRREPCQMLASKALPGSGILCRDGASQWQVAVNLSLAPFQPLPSSRQSSRPISCN